MGGFTSGKRSTSSTRGNKDKRLRRDTAGSSRSRANSSRVAPPRGGRGQKRKSSGVDGEEEEEEIRPSQRHVLYEDDEEDDALAQIREPGGTLIGNNIWIPPKAAQKEHDLKGERLIIEKLICENFKSYGGVKEMGPFHKSFSAVVGPNGNGKSNIIDALLFVFGYRSTKIRCKKMSLLIHKSELLPNIQSCSVAVHFVKILDEGDEDSITVVPDSRITVMRTVDKNNTSVYKLDGRTVQFHEVAEFLKANGVDIIHNRFLILQGEVESISQLPPKRKSQHESGLLEFLEEVIGTKRYMKCLHQLEEAIEKLNFTRESKLVSVDIVEKELLALKEPVSKAKEYLREQNAVTRSKHQLQQLQMAGIKTELSDLEKEKKEAEEKIAETDKQLAELKVGNSDREKTFAEKEKRVKTLEQDGHRMQKIIASTEAKFTKVKEQIQNDNTRRKAAMKEITTKEKEMEILEQVPTQSEKEVKILTKRREDLNCVISKEEETVKKDLAKIETEVEKYSAESKELTKAFVEAKSIRDLAKKKSETLESELKVAKEKSEGEAKKLETFKQELEDLKNKTKENERSSRSSLGNKLGALEKELQEKKAERDSVLEEEKIAEPELEQARAAYDNARQMFQESQTDDAIYKAFFEEKSKGRLTGVYGRLRDLATIDEKYNVAATVSSGLWDHWVVDNEITGEEAIQFLRQKNLQFQNFQCLSKLQKFLQFSRQSFTPPPQALRLFDLIKVTKPEVTSAFYKALGNTLVTDNLDIGSKIGYAPQNKCKVATLNGEIIDPNGAMTGGGRQKIIGKLNGRMAARLNRSMSESEYSEIKETLDVAQKKYSDLFGRRQALDNEIQALTVQFRQAQEKLNASKTDPEAMKKRIGLKEKQVEEQSQKVKESNIDPKYLKTKEKELASLVAAYEETVEPCNEAEATAKKVEDKLKRLRGEKTKEIRKKLDFSLEQRKKVIEDLERHTIALRNYDENHKKLSASIENLKNEKVRLETEMRELEVKKSELTEKGVEVTKEMDAIKAELDEGKKELLVLKKSMGEVSKKRGELESRRGKEAIELGNAAGKFKAIAGKVDSIKRKLADLKLEEIPNEQVEPLNELTEEELNELDVEELEEFITKTTQELKKQSPNLLILEQYKNKVDEFVRKVAHLDEITVARDTHRNAYVATLLQRVQEFMSGFAIISVKLKEMFRMISMGGDAELDLVDSTDPYSLGINFCVRPTGKSWKNISHLSGGEKTLSSLALIFALHHFKPSPFYVMDEIDAALDFKNVSIIANYIKDRTKFTQFVIVSLRANMFELADSMLGIVKVDNISFAIHLGVSKLLTQLREKFLEAGKPFPLENEYMSNNRCHRQQQMVKAIESKKKQEEEDNLFNANYSIIDEEDDDLLPNLSQPEPEQGWKCSQKEQDEGTPQTPPAESGSTDEEKGRKRRKVSFQSTDNESKNETVGNLTKIEEEEEDDSVDQLKRQQETQRTKACHVKLMDFRTHPHTIGRADTPATSRAGTPTTSHADTPAIGRAEKSKNMITVKEEPIEETQVLSRTRRGAVRGEETSQSLRVVQEESDDETQVISRTRSATVKGNKTRRIVEDQTDEEAEITTRTRSSARKWNKTRQVVENIKRSPQSAAEEEEETVADTQLLGDAETVAESEAEMTPEEPIEDEPSGTGEEPSQMEESQSGAGEEPSQMEEGQSGAGKELSEMEEGQSGAGEEPSDSGEEEEEPSEANEKSVVAESSEEYESAAEEL